MVCDLSEITSGEFFSWLHQSLADLNREMDHCTNVIHEISTEPLNIKVEQASKDSEGFVFPWEQRYYDEDQKRIKRFETAKDRAKLFRDASSHHLGRVFAASGEKLWHRIGNSSNSLDTIIDWALVEIPKERMGDNKVKPYHLIKLANN